MELIKELGLDAGFVAEVTAPIYVLRSAETSYLFWHQSEEFTGWGGLDGAATFSAMDIANSPIPLEAMNGQITLLAEVEDWQKCEVCGERKPDVEMRYTASGVCYEQRACEECWNTPEG